ncbi:hypothetical protein LWM68_41625 [Niabella sp. W65]|nr:hypothetical protein [Niabella sp. W65]MCH7368668.1 hypothetical protein [Niabella sp. W65]
MSEIKLPRLLQAAKEFNIGQDTLVDFLVGKGFAKDDLKPSSKLSEAMYAALQQGFQSDKAAKLKSSQVDLPKGVGNEAKKRKKKKNWYKRKSRLKQSLLLKRRLLQTLRPKLKYGRSPNLSLSLSRNLSLSRKRASGTTTGYRAQTRSR